MGYNAQWEPVFTDFPDLRTAGMQDLVNMSRNDPMISDRIWLPNSPKLFPYQKIAIRGMYDHFVTWMQAVRGGAKSWIVARALLNMGLNFPLKIGFTAPTYRQALHPFNYVDGFIEQNRDISLPLSLSREQDGITVRGSMEASIYLKNGTVFKALPMGNGERLRGERFDILHCDEFFLMERIMFQTHLLPFLLGHRDPDSFGPKLVLTTSAEYEDSFAYSVLTKNIIPKMIEEDELVAANHDYKRTYCVIDVNVDDLRAEGYALDKDVLALLLQGANNEERQQALYNKWIGTSGQFFPPNLADRMASPQVRIEHRGDGVHQYAFSVDVATQRDGDFFVIDVFKFLGDKRFAQVNTFWDKGLTADEMARKIMEYDDLFNPEWIVMDKGGGGLFVRDSLKKKHLEMRDGSLFKVTNAILEHDENAQIAGTRKLIFNRANDVMVRAALAGWRSRGGEYISTEDVLVHHLHEGLKQLFLQDDMPILIPAEYSDQSGTYDSEAIIYDRIRTGVHQLRHLAIELKETSDGQKEVVRSKVAKVPKYVWKSGNKDGASAFIYAFIAYALHYRDDGNDEQRPMPIIVPSQNEFPNYEGMTDYSPGQLWRP